MENKYTHPFKASIVGVLIIVTIASCKKKDVVQLTKSSEVEAQYKDYDKVLSFFSWSVGVSKDSIRFDSLKHEFTIPNTMVKESFSRVQEEYNKANEYKLTFEGK